MSKVFRVDGNSSSACEVEPYEDGAVCVDKATNTRVYYGKAAKEFVEESEIFNSNTQVVLSSSGLANIVVEGEGVTFGQTSAIILAPGTTASIKILEGFPMVITSDKPTERYSIYGRGKGKVRENDIKNDTKIEDFTQMYCEIVKINQGLYSPGIYAKLFDKDDLDTMVNSGFAQIMNGNFVQWSKFSSRRELEEKLSTINFSAEKIEKYANLWIQSKKQEFYSRDSGKICEKDLSEEVIKKLTGQGLLKKMNSFSQYLFWTSYETRESLAEKLNNAKLTEEELSKTLNLWDKTNRSIYDNSGLIWEKEGVVIYSLKEKMNLWSGQRTEWVTNSMAYTGNFPCTYTGVSNVISQNTYEHAVPYTTIRPAETLHEHPSTKDFSQSEIYHVISGQATLLTFYESSPQINVLKRGDIAIISPDTPHCVTSIKGKYEHLVVQVPSAFQYGFKCKRDLSFDKFNCTKEEIVTKSLRENEKADFKR